MPKEYQRGDIVWYDGEPHVISATDSWGVVILGIGLGSHAVSSQAAKEFTSTENEFGDFDHEIMEGTLKSMHRDLMLAADGVLDELDRIKGRAK